MDDAVTALLSDIEEMLSVVDQDPEGSRDAIQERIDRYRRENGGDDTPE